MNRNIKVLIMSFCSMITLILSYTTIYADEIYSDRKWIWDYIHVANPFQDALRSIGYGILILLSKIIDVTYEAINVLLGINLMKITPIANLVDKMSPLAWGVLTITLIFMGIMLILGFKKKSEVARGVLLSLILMVSIPFMFTTLNQFKDIGVNDVNKLITGNGSIGQQILRSNTIDLVASTEGVTILEPLENPYHININQRIPDNDNYFIYKINNVWSDTAFGDRLENGFFGWGKERIYKLDFKFIETFIILVITLIALIFAGFKISRTIFDLCTHQLIAGVVFASDVGNSGRSKKFMQSLISSYIVLIFILIMVKIYLDLSAWASLNITNIWARILLLGGASWGVIDGPEIIVKLLGVDSGVRSATSVMAGTMAASNVAKMAKGAIGSTKTNPITGKKSGFVGMASNVAKGTKKIPSVASSIAGGISGLKDSIGNIKSGFAESKSNDFSGAKDYNSALKSINADQKQSGFSKGKSAVRNTSATVGYALGETSDRIKSNTKGVKGFINGDKEKSQSGKQTDTNMAGNKTDKADSNNSKGNKSNPSISPKMIPKQQASPQITESKGGKKNGSNTKTN